MKLFDMFTIDSNGSMEKTVKASREVMDRQLLWEDWIKNTYMSVE